MRYVSVVLILVLAGAGCGKTPVAPTAVPSRQLPDTAQSVEEHRIDIGDVEAAVRVEGVLAPDAAAPNIVANNLTGKDDIIAISTIAVSPPVPPELWVEFTVKSARAFPDRPAVVQFTVYRAGGTVEESIGNFAIVLGAGANLPSAGSERTLRVNALAGLAAHPESLLLHTRGRLFLLPPDADPATIDAQAPNASPMDTSEALQANPVRIEFKPEAQP